MVELDQYDLIASIEADHWWYRRIRWTVVSLVGRRRRNDGRPLRILELGAGTGAASSDLEGVVAVDRTERSMVFLRDRPVTAIRADATALPIPGGTFDVVVAVNLLHSVADPSSVLAEAARVLVPGGCLVLIEPAFSFLQRAHDERVDGLRRFRRPELRHLVEAVGLEVRRSTYAFSFLVPPAAAQGLAYRLRRSVEEVPTSIKRRRLDGVLGMLSAAERALLGERNVPFGTSVALLAERGRDAGQRGRTPRVTATGAPASSTASSTSSPGVDVGAGTGSRALARPTAT
ncbi:MAG: class I SAM-dependent methyltransferase [Acidimicrobiales bacterium]